MPNKAEIPQMIEIFSQNVNKQTRRKKYTVIDEMNKWKGHNLCGECENI